MSEPFKFKQFTIQQDRCAMKVGTDGVLLGAWADISHDPQSILDIGAGTGLIALQLAQRSNAFQVDAVEIQPDAYEQAVDNFENSPWNDRLFCYHASLQEFAEEMDEQYDLIVSNPPFYNDHYAAEDPSRNIARSTGSLSFSELLEAAEKLLHTDGRFNIIIPHQYESSFLELAARHQLYAERICRVKGRPETDFKRSLISMSRNKLKCSTTQLVIETGRHEYTPDYISLVGDFYLKM